MAMEDRLDRFLDGQRFIYDCALEEIRDGRKTGHWIWYVFPQMRGLGHSPNSMYYGISSIEEAQAYLGHPVLGERLRQISAELLKHDGMDAVDILGPIDAKKVRSCMTLFDMVSPEDIFAQVLDTFYGGRRCRRTMEMMVGGE